MTCADIPQKLIDGYNCAVIAYGAVGTGKTYTILGDSWSTSQHQRFRDPHREKGQEDEETEPGETTAEKTRRGTNITSHDHKEGRDEEDPDSNRSDDTAAAATATTTLTATTTTISTGATNHSTTVATDSTTDTVHPVPTGPRHLIDDAGNHNVADPDRGSSCVSIYEGRTTTQQQQLQREHSHQENATLEEHQGIVYRLAQDIFQTISKTHSTAEITIRCSVVEVYLNRIRDLLVESTTVFCDQGKLQQCARLSCCCAQDICNIVRRAAAVRTLSARDPSRESTRSSLIVQIELEQIHTVSQQSVVSRLVLFDLVGSEFVSVTPQSGTVADRRRMISATMQSLDRYIKDVKTGKEFHPDESTPVMTRLLMNYLGGGGNAHTVMILTTAAHGAGTIGEILPTIQFGQNCQVLQNRPTPCVYPIWQEQSKKMQETDVKLFRLESLTKVLAAECKRLSSRAPNRLSTMAVEEIIKGIVDADMNHRDLDFTVETKQEHQIRTEQMRLRAEMRHATEERNKAIHENDQLRSELMIVQSQIPLLRDQLDKIQQEHMSIKDEYRSMKDENTQLEYSLRTSQFRESEAIVFLRQLRRFYFRLMRTISLEGSVGVQGVLSHISGAPDLNELVDLDQLMVECGLLDQSEIGIDTLPQAEPHDDPGGRSSTAAQTMFKKSLSVNAVPEQSQAGLLVSISELPPRCLSAISREESSDKVEARQKLYSTPSGQYIVLRENILEEEVLSLRKKNIDLENELEHEKAKVDSLTERTGVAAALEKLKHAKEIKDLRDRLDKREADLKAVVLKMNELVVTGKTLQEECTGKDQHINYLEGKLRDLLISNNQIRSEVVAENRSLRQELAILRGQTKELSAPVWHLEKNSNPMIPVECRLVIPIHAGQEVIEQATRRNSLGVPGEWLEDASAKVYVEIGTQVSQTVIDAEMQTDPTCLDCPKLEIATQTDPVEITFEKTLVESEMQTDPVQVAPECILNEAEVQTDPIPIGRMLGDAEAVTNDDGTCILCGCFVGETQPEDETNIDALLFMARDSPISSGKLIFEASITGERLAAIPPLSVEDDDERIQGNSLSYQRDEKVARIERTIGVIDDSSQTPFTSLPIVENKPEVKNESDDITHENDEEDKSPNGFDHETAVTSNQPLATSSASESESRKLSPAPISPVKPKSFMEKLRQQQARKKDNDVGEGEDNVPEFLRKFRTIGSRNMGEKVLEASGSAPAQEMTRTFGGESLKHAADPAAPAPVTSSKISWKPTKKDDDSDNSDPWAHRGSGAGPVSVESEDFEQDDPWGHVSDNAGTSQTTAVTNDDQQASLIHQEKKDDSDSDTESEDDKKPSMISGSELSNDKAGSDNDSTTDEEDLPKISLTQISSTKMKGDSDSEDEQLKQDLSKPKSVTPPPTEQAVAKLAKYSDENQIASKPIPSSVLTNRVDSSDSEDTLGDEKESASLSTKQGNFPAPRSPLVTRKTDSDSDSDSGDEKKPSAPFSTPLSATKSNLANDTVTEGELKSSLVIPATPVSHNSEQESVPVENMQNETNQGSEPPVLKTDSDSESDSIDEPIISRTTPKNQLESESDSEEEPETSGQTSIPTKEGESGDSDSEDEEKAPEPISVTPASKSDSESKSDTTAGDKYSGPIVVSSVSKTSGSNHESDSEDERKSSQVSPLAVVSEQFDTDTKPDSDEGRKLPLSKDSDTESEDEQKIPVPIASKRIDTDDEPDTDDGNELDSESEDEKKRTLETPVSIASKAKDESDSDSDSAGRRKDWKQDSGNDSKDREEARKHPTPSLNVKKENSDSESDSDIQSDSGDEKKRPLPVPVTAPKQNDRGEDKNASLRNSVPSASSSSKSNADQGKTVLMKKPAEVMDICDSDSDSDSYDGKKPQPQLKVHRGKHTDGKAKHDSDSESSHDDISSDEASDVGKPNATAKGNISHDSDIDESSATSSDEDGRARNTNPSKPVTEVPQFFNTVKPATTTTEGKNKFKIKGGKLIKDDKPSGVKFIMQGGKLIKVEDQKLPSKSKIGHKVGKATPTDEDDGFDVVVRENQELDDNSQWGKVVPASPSRNKKKNFVIRNGKLVKEDAASPVPAKKTMGKTSFKIVGGKLVKEGDDPAPKKEKKGGKKKDGAADGAKKKKKLGLF